MILKKFKLKTDIKNTPEKINQSNIQILKKTLSDLSIKIKKKKVIVLYQHQIIYGEMNLQIY